MMLWLPLQPKRRADQPAKINPGFEKRLQVR
jgi:hypothetical protein